MRFQVLRQGSGSADVLADFWLMLFSQTSGALNLLEMDTFRQHSVEDEAKTRLRNNFTLSAWVHVALGTPACRAENHLGAFC